MEGVGTTPDADVKTLARAIRGTFRRIQSRRPRARGLVRERFSPKTSESDVFGTVSRNAVPTRQPCAAKCKRAARVSRSVRATRARRTRCRAVPFMATRSDRDRRHLPLRSAGRSLHDGSAVGIRRRKRSSCRRALTGTAQAYPRCQRTALVRKRDAAKATSILLGNTRCGWWRRRRSRAYGIRTCNVISRRRKPRASTSPRRRPRASPSPRARLCCRGRDRHGADVPRHRISLTYKARRSARAVLDRGADHGHISSAEKRWKRISRRSTLSILKASRVTVLRRLDGLCRRLQTLFALRFDLRSARIPVPRRLRHIDCT